jgi:Tol biopolymer transport system component
MRRVNRFGILAALLFVVSAAHAENNPRLIAFQQGRKIALIQPDGSGLRTLVEDAATGIPYWSPDGTRIAFLSLFRGQTGFQENLSIINADGSDRHTLPDGDGPNPPRPADQRPDDPLSTIQNMVWSPDSQQIAFEWTNWQREALFVVNADGSSPRRMPHGGVSAEVAWSRDSRELAYIGHDYDRISLYITSADGRRSRTVLPDAHRVSSFIWSPDEKQFIFMGSGPDSYRPDIYRIDADGSNLARLTSGEDSYRLPSWSADGAYILMVRSVAIGGPGDVYVMKRDGSDGRFLTQTGDVTGARWFGNTHQIVYYFRKDKLNALRLLDFDGHILPVPDKAADALMVRWSPDGQQIAFIRTEDNGERGLYVVDADGTDLRRIADGTGWPTWQPGG